MVSRRLFRRQRSAAGGAHVMNGHSHTHWLVRPAWMPAWSRKLIADGHKAGATAKFIRYGFALLCILAAMFLTMALQQIEIGRPPLLLFSAAIVISAWFGGAGPAAIAVLLSLLAGIYFYSVESEGLEYQLDNVVVLLLLLFTLCAGAGQMLGAWRRRAEEALTYKAQQLQQAYDALRSEISERRRTEQALQEARAELARAARLTAMGELAANIAHEVNQPLAAISNSASACTRWLEADPPNLKEVRLLNSWILRDSERAAAVISRVRNMVRSAMPQKAVLDLNRSIHDVLDTLEYDLHKHRVKVNLALDPALPRIMADRVQIQQVFLNVLTNAVEAMAQAMEERHLVVRSARRDGAILIEIEDSGGGYTQPGEQLFQPFFTTKPSGMGLGLAICRSIVENHGGTLMVAPGARGACFRLILPGGG